MAGERVRLQGRKIAVNPEGCRENGKRNHFDAEIRASNAIALRFKNSFARSSYLKRLPLDQIKIDQSFVRDITSDPNDAAIVQAIIAMTEALGLNVIAEGVETEAQRDFLEIHGCHAFQGYLYSKPVPLEQFELLLGGL